ncbi:hypothetical protein P3T27_002142 [Kitasatospora sp. MAA19]|uniref:Lsr2 family DNA-binding protein n=1 Tax=Kitasatospora sp. MAA19 TaxID=3035090 RepID=UPI0024760CD4|nr:hypothetical protein [Kitasatospora sp. MAA19]MDH6705432.1 hypothetical protein [Kitasatospora sp. MAA19]
MRAFMVESGLRDPDNTSDITPPEVRYFQNYKPSHDARKASERAAQERMDEQWRRADESRKRAEHHALHMKRCREWGRKKGFTVGARGSISKVVREAYREATGVEL